STSWRTAPNERSPEEPRLFERPEELRVFERPREELRVFKSRIICAARRRFSKLISESGLAPSLLRLPPPPRSFAIRDPASLVEDPQPRSPGGQPPPRQCRRGRCAAPKQAARPTVPAPRSSARSRPAVRQAAGYGPG